MKRVRPAVESERTVLGAILLDQSCFRSAAQRLTSKDFDIYFHEEIFQAMCDLFDKHGSIDAAMIVDKLQLRIDHEQYLLELANNCPSTANVLAHCEIIREKSVQRELLKVQEEVLLGGKGRLSPGKRLGNFFEDYAQEIKRKESVSPDYLIGVLYETTKAIHVYIEELINEE